MKILFLINTVTSYQNNFYNELSKREKIKVIVLSKNYKNYNFKINENFYEFIEKKYDKKKEIHNIIDNFGPSCIIFGGYRTKRDIDFMNDDITNERSFTGFDDIRYTFKDGFYYEEDNPQTTVDESTKPLSKDEVRSYNQISNFYTGENRPNNNNNNNDDEEDFVPDNLAPKEAKRAMQKQVMAISDGPGTLEQKNKRINQIKKAFSEKYPNINN